MAAPLQDKKNPWLLILIFLLFSLSLMWAGFSSYLHQKQQVARETIASLETVANLKAAELAWWRLERLGDARVMTSNPWLSREIKNLTEFPHARSSRQSLLDWFRIYQKIYRYQSVVLLDAQGELLLQAGIPHLFAGPFLQKHIQEVIRNPRIIFSDFFWDTESQSFRCLILSPVFHTGQTSLQGIVVLRIDPHNSIFPLLQTWPSACSSAETVLAYREGDEVVLLNQFNHQLGAAPPLRLSLDQEDIPAVQAIKGREGFVRGEDYRRVPVFAVVCSVPDSPWFLVAKVDEKKVFAESEKYALHAGSLMGVMILAVGLGLTILWRQHYLHYPRQLAKLEAAQTKKLDDILSATPDQFFLIDNAGRYLYANQAASQVLSLTPGELSGKKIQDGGFPAETGNHLAAQTAAVFHSGRPLAGEVSFPSQETLKFFDYILTPLRDPQGSVNSVLATFRDITDRKHIEQRLQEELHFKETLLEAIPSPIFFKDLQGRYLGCNRAFETFIGLSRQVFVGKSVFELAPAELAAIYHAKDVELLEQRQVQSYESQVKTADGQTSEVIFYKAPFTHLNGALAGLIGVIIDITDRRRMEEDLRQAKEFLSSILAHAPMPFFVNQRDGRFLLVNPAWEALTGQNQEAALGHTLDELFSPETAKLFNKTNQQIFQTGNPIEIEETVILRGQKYHFQSVKFPLLNAQGEIDALGGITLDITTRKQAEEQVKASLREKEVLLKEIHHRVKNNMQIISSMLRLQSSRVKNREVQEVFQESQNRIRSMALVHEMLYRSPDLSRVHFSSYLKVLANSLYRSFRVDPKHITLRLDSEDFYLAANQALSCGLIITELLSNSFKYAFPAGHQGELSLTTRQTPDGEIKLVVHDNGVGFPPDLDYRTTESLGLRLVMLLVGQLQGSVEVDRMGGTSFIITFKVQDHE